MTRTFFVFGCVVGCIFSCGGSDSLGGTAEADELQDTAADLSICRSCNPTTPTSFDTAPPACSATCTASSRCDTRCTNGTESTCGAFGVCQSCSATCSTATHCGLACLNGGQLAQCFTANKPCTPCTAAACEVAGCGAYCMNPPSAGACPRGDCAAVIVDSTPTYSRCDAYGARLGDKDTDGLPDALELELARRFVPNLHMGYGSQTQFYGLNQTVSPHWLTGTTTATVCANNPNCKLPFVARKVPPLRDARNGWCAAGQCVELSFALPYNWDLGDPETGASEHRGDAEFVSVIVAYRRADDEADGTDWGTTWEVAKNDASVWRYVAKFYAAHLCADSWDSSSMVFPRTGNGYFSTDTMVAWVANSKNGSYPSSDSCEGGAYWQDSCAGGAWVPRSLYVPKLVNVGDNWGGSLDNVGLVCAGFDRVIAAPAAHSGTAPSSTLDVWGTARFDTSTSLYNLFRRGEVNWGTGGHLCW